MGVVGVVAFHIVTKARFKIVGRREIPAFEKTTGQDAEPQLHLIEPRPMLGGKVKHMLMGRIAQERPALRTAAQGLGEVRDVTPLGHELAELKAPMGIEIVDHPIVSQHRG